MACRERRRLKTASSLVGDFAGQLLGWHVLTRCEAWVAAGTLDQFEAPLLGAAGTTCWQVANSADAYDSICIEWVHEVSKHRRQPVQSMCSDMLKVAVVDAVVPKSCALGVWSSVGRRNSEGSYFSVRAKRRTSIVQGCHCTRAD